MAPGRVVDALDRFQIRLAAQEERLVMHGEKILETGIMGYSACLFRYLLLAPSWQQQASRRKK